jgi:O-antigen/teichoic acid export membrane protein
MLRSIRQDEQKLLWFILRSASGTLALRVFSMAAIFVTRVLLARALGIEGFGVFSYALTWLDMLSVAAVFGLERMIVRELAVYRTQEDWGRAKAVIRFSLILTTLLSFGIVGVSQIVLWFSQRQNALRLAQAYIGAPVMSAAAMDGIYLSIALIIIGLPLLSVIRVGRAILQASQHIVVGQIPEYVLRPLLFLGLLLLPLWHLTAWRSSLLYTLVIVLVSVISLVLLKRYIVSKDAQAQYDYRLWFSSLVPLALLEGAYFINGRIAVIALGLLTNSTEVGLFSVADRIMTLLALTLYATNYALAPHFARFYTQRDWKQLQFITTWGARGVFLIASLASLVMIAFANPILALFGAEFVAARQILIILVVGQLFNAFTGSVTTLLTTTYHERETTRAVMMSAVLSLIANAILIPTFGAVGAALASTLGLIYWNVHLVIYARRSLGVDTTALGIFSRRRTLTDE